MSVKQVSITNTALFLVALCMLPGCNRGSTSITRAQDSQAANSSPVLGLHPTTGQNDGPNRCTLLTDDEVRDAIGAHGAGTSDAGNMWGLQGCRWMATAAGKDGWTDLIEVALFWKNRESWAREQAQAQGELVQGFVDGARYNPSSGDFWFNCAHSRFCVVTARIGSGARRPQVARHLAELVEKRLQ